MYIALATIVVHLFTGGRYGFHRDELATLDDARHLAWGYVAYPPVTPFFGRLSLILFGNSLAGFRLFASVAEAAAVLLTGLMARELGGRRGAQLVAAFAALPFCLGAGALMQYVSFDYFFWVLTAYFVLRLLKSENPRWWLAIGASIGLGMMSKYSMPFFVAGLLVGVLLTPARRFLSTKWLWLGVAVSLAIFLPNLLWQVQHHFVSIDFLGFIHARDVRIGRTKDFLPGQLTITLLAFPIWIVGLYYFLFSSSGRRFRVLGWMYVVPLLLFIVAKGRSYYLAGTYPMLYAAGAVWGEQWLVSLRRGWAAAVRVLVRAALIADVVIIFAVVLPVAPVNTRWWRTELSVNGDLREEFGWPELVETVAKIRDSLSPQDRVHLGVLVGNYGEAGAIDLYGPRYNLPHAISGINSFWLRGYGNPPPQTLIVMGLSKQFLAENFASCRLVAHTWNYFGVENEETRDHPDIFVCRDLRRSWPELWRDVHDYG
ncbi:MAG TPA: glycosyltransferase family 39 protein [Terriglobales bacterium]|nr:glycosyltransferase family 39 protein [Terriglobales bacterium]